MSDPQPTLCACGCSEVARYALGHTNNTADPLAKIQRGTGSDCWTWTGSHDRKGYGRVQYQGVNTTAHRVVYTLLVGPIPAGMHLDHLCRVVGCVRPDHLEAVTPAENRRRQAVAYRETKSLQAVSC